MPKKGLGRMDRKTKKKCKRDQKMKIHHFNLAIQR